MNFELLMSELNYKFTFPAFANENYAHTLLDCEKEELKVFY